MLEIVVGALIAAAAGFLSSWAILRIQRKSTEALTLRLRALELQEPSLRWLSRELHSLAFLGAFADANPLPRPLSGDPTGDFKWPGWLNTGWAGVKKAKEILQAWEAEHEAVVFDATVLELMKSLETEQDEFSRALKAVNAIAKPEEWSEDAVRRAQLAGDAVLMRSIEAKLAADRARGLDAHTAARRVTR